MAKHQSIRWLKVVSARTAIVVSFTFLTATNYCSLEAFAEHVESSHHHEEASPRSHDEGSSIPDHDQDSCCATLQAIVTPTTNLHLVHPSAAALSFLALSTSGTTTLIDVAHVASGLSPPAREPTPTVPFYRTTFASHAPPIFLA